MAVEQDAEEVERLALVPLDVVPHGHERRHDGQLVVGGRAAHAQPHVVLHRQQVRDDDEALEAAIRQVGVVAEAEPADLHRVHRAAVARDVRAVGRPLVLAVGGVVDPREVRQLGHEKARVVPEGQRDAGQLVGRHVHRRDVERALDAVVARERLAQPRDELVGALQETRARVVGDGRGGGRVRAGGIGAGRGLTVLGGPALDVGGVVVGHGGSGKRGGVWGVRAGASPGGGPGRGRTAQRAMVSSRRIFFCNCMIPYSSDSAVGGHPGT